jgi:hypothetical protein
LVFWMSSWFRAVRASFCMDDAIIDMRLRALFMVSSWVVE